MIYTRLNIFIPIESVILIHHEQISTRNDQAGYPAAINLRVPSNENLTYDGTIVQDLAIDQRLKGMTVVV